MAPLFTEEALANVRVNVGNPRGLPVQCYLSDEVARWEERHLFLSGWLFVTSAANLENNGDFLTRSFGDEGFLTVRGTDGRVRTFRNVCQHRGCRLISQDSGNVRSLRCYYHSWNYDLRGKLRAAPHAELTADERAELALDEVRTEVVCGLVFMDPTGSAQPLLPLLGDLVDYLERYRLDELVLGERRTWSIAANWKVVGENLAECGHCPHIHPEFNRLTSYLTAEESAGPGVYHINSMTLSGDMETISADGTRAGRGVLPGVPGDDLRKVHFLHFFPGLLVGLYPDHVSVQWYFPTGTETTESGAEWLFAAPDADRDNADIYDFVTMVLRQDWDVCEEVQRGIKSTGYRGGIYTERERRTHALAWMIADTYVMGERPTRAPVTFTAAVS